MNSLRMSPTEFDTLRTAILATAKWESELSIWNRSGDCYVQIRRPDGKSLISETTADAFSAEVRRYFEGKSDSFRRDTSVFLRLRGGTNSLFFAYRTRRDLLEIERSTLEVPKQIIGLVQFLECMENPKVEFHFGHDPDAPWNDVEFVLSQEVEIGDITFINSGSISARPSFDFIWRVAGEYLESIILHSPPNTYGSTYAVNFVLEEEKGVTYFRMYNGDQRFFSVEKDKLRGEKS